MGCDVMSVRLWLPRISVLGVLVDAPEQLAVGVCSTVRRPECPGCGTACSRVHDRRDKKVRDLEVSGRPVTLVWSRRRMVCEVCERRFLEGHPAFKGSVTARLVDETSIRKRHRCVTVIVNADSGRTLAMIPHRGTAALSVFWGSPGAPLVPSRQGGRLRRLEGLHGRDRRPAGARPPRAGPIPRHPMVRSRAGRGAPRRPAPHPARRHPGIRPRRDLDGAPPP